MQVAMKNQQALRSTPRSSVLAVARPVIQRRVAAQAFEGGKLPVDASSVVGERIGKWLATPVDLLAFPSRAGLGALASAPARLSSMQSDWQRLVDLVQDNTRPIEEKQANLRKELEDTVLEFLEKGTNIEQDMLSNLKSMLPTEAANALTELIPEPPNKVPQTGPVVAVDPADISSVAEPAVPYSNAYPPSAIYVDQPPKAV